MSILDRHDTAGVGVADDVITLDLLDAFLERFCHVRGDHTRQRDDGAYYRTGEPIVRETIVAHLRGIITVAPYLMGEGDTVRVGVLDHDDKRWIPTEGKAREGQTIEEDGLALLQDARERLQRQGIDSALEESRRGRHLWVFAHEAVTAEDMRALLLLAVGRDERRAMLHGERAFELHPVANQRPRGGVGDTMRLPLGVQRKEARAQGSGRHPFVDRTGASVARTMGGQVRYVVDVEEAQVRRHLTERPWLGEALRMIDAKPWQYQRTQERVVDHTPRHGRIVGLSPIQEWVRQVNCRDVVEGYGIPVRASGQARCPWPAHHANGDRNPSFSVTPTGWRCWSSGMSGNAFDFVALQMKLDPETLRAGGDPEGVKRVFATCLERHPIAQGPDLGRSMALGR